MELEVLDVEKQTYHPRGSGRDRPPLRTYDRLQRHSPVVVWSHPRALHVNRSYGLLLGRDNSTMVGFLHRYQPLRDVSNILRCSNGHVLILSSGSTTHPVDRCLPHSRQTGSEHVFRNLRLQLFIPGQVSSQGSEAWTVHSLTSTVYVRYPDDWNGYGVHHILLHDGANC